MGHVNICDGQLVWLDDILYKVSVNKYKQSGRRERVSASLKRVGFSTKKIKERLGIGEN